MENTPPQFLAASIGGGAVSKDGHDVTIEFGGDGALLWVTLPASLLPQLQLIVRDLDALAIDARNGVAGCARQERLGRPQSGWPLFNGHDRKTRTVSRRDLAGAPVARSREHEVVPGACR